ncbi:MAG: class I SAM-dependent methyltransferase [Candidatus Binatia bacterium]
MAEPDKAIPTMDQERIREFYDSVYYRDADKVLAVPCHLRRLAKKLGPWTGQRVLDVACGTGSWLEAVASLGAIPAGIDISQKALEICRRALPEAELHYGPAEKLPFSDRQFDVISCLGALEHFLDPHAALREMIRVAKPNAVFVLLVPNSGFPPLRLGLYSGTQQADVREEARSLSEWSELFDGAGLTVRHRWRDLHVLSPSWIFRGRWYAWPLRAAQASVLPFWPLSWQYQVFHLCTVKR